MVRVQVKLPQTNANVLENGSRPDDCLQKLIPQVKLVLVAHIWTSTLGIVRQDYHESKACQGYSATLVSQNKASVGDTPASPS